MHFLDPDTVPTMGDWFRAAGYRTHYRGKWHVSHPDLVDARAPTRACGRTTSTGSSTPPRSTPTGAPTGSTRSGSRGGSGASRTAPTRPTADSSRDGVFAEQVVDLFAELAAADDDAPWLAVASFVNPHDIAFSGFGVGACSGSRPIAESIPDIPEAPSQSDSFAGRPDCQRAVP